MTHRERSEELKGGLEHRGKDCSLDVWPDLYPEKLLWAQESCAAETLHRKSVAADLRDLWLLKLSLSPALQSYSPASSPAGHDSPRGHVNDCWGLQTIWWKQKGLWTCHGVPNQTQKWIFVTLCDFGSEHSCALRNATQLSCYRSPMNTAWNTSDLTLLPITHCSILLYVQASWSCWNIMV